MRKCLGLIMCMALVILCLPLGAVATYLFLLRCEIEKRHRKASGAGVQPRCRDTRLMPPRSSPWADQEEYF